MILTRAPELIKPSGRPAAYYVNTMQIHLSTNLSSLYAVCDMTTYTRDATKKQYKVGMCSVEQLCSSLQFMNTLTPTTNKNHSYIQWGM